jgi:ABC-2 type transport system ATP-binding protein
MTTSQIGLFVEHPSFPGGENEKRPGSFKIEVRELSKYYGDLCALSGLSLNISQGTLFGFIGPNGAGKSTAIRCMTGLLRTTRGSVRLLGQELTADSVNIKRRIGLMPESLSLFDQLYAGEFLEIQARLYGLDAREAARRAHRLLGSFDLEDSSGRLIEFSAGMRKKAAFAAAIIHGPEILFLDEPFESMDAGTVAMLKDWMRGFTARGGTVFMTSHALETVEHFCSHVALINHGQLVWESPPGLVNLRDGLHYQGRKFASLEALYLEVLGTGCVHLEWS